MAILTRGELLCVGECIGTISRYNNCTSSRRCGIVSTTILGKGLCSSYYVPRRRRRRSLERELGVRWCCKDDDRDDDDDDGRGWTGGSGRGVGRKGSSVFVCFAQQSLYETLGVPSSASEKEIRQAYRRMALKYHPDVNKKADAQEQFLRIKNAYQTLVDSNSRAKYDASQRSRTAADWDPFQWSPSRPKGNSTVQEEDFYGFEDFLRDLESDMSKRQGSRSKQGKMKSLWEELADIGEEFVEFLEKELNIDEGEGDKKQGADFAKQQRQPPKGAYDSSKASRQDAPDDKRKVETETAEIEDMLAKLKKELGI
ncbi:hypothetical protein CY35_05G086800 [Sphagnum magellanicum]|nr:hypothetical protein CY35_05G086800 [Sphagnum magellanicum]KAH9562726.1 hypothetical protein CY35_05G086800 [Sphagnum magellanicum]